MKRHFAFMLIIFVMWELNPMTSSYYCAEVTASRGFVRWLPIYYCESVQ